MKQTIFCGTVLLMLSFSLTGITRSTAFLLSYLNLPLSLLRSFYLAVFILILLIWALAWAVPAGG